MLQTRKAIQAFLPFWITLVVSMVVLGWECHRRYAPYVRLHANFTIEGGIPDEPISMQVNGKHIDYGQPIPLGPANIRFVSPNCLDTKVSRFIWYGVTELGPVDLTRKRGSIAVLSKPAAETYVISGKNGSWSNETGAFEGIPYGAYQLMCRYGGRTCETPLSVAQPMEQVEAAVDAGFLKLASATIGKFELHNAASGEIWMGSFPTNLRYLPAAEYRLLEQTPDYTRTHRIHVRANETNTLKLRAAYGAVSVTTEPTGASVALDGQTPGNSPMTFTKVVPGTHRLELSLLGHDAVQATLEVGENATISTNIALTNTRYRTAMADAERLRSSGRYELALDAVGVALLERTGDLAASVLLKEVSPKALKEKADRLHESGDFDAALAALNEAAKDTPDDTEIAAVKDRIVKARDLAIRKRNEESFRRLLDDAKESAGRKEFRRGLELLSEAEKVKPGEADTVALRSEFEVARSKADAEEAEQRRTGEIAARETERNRLWYKVEQQDSSAKRSQLSIWKVKKGAAGVKAALERMETVKDGMPVSDFQEQSPLLFTARVKTTKMINSHGKIAVVEQAPGTAEIWWEIFRYDTPVTQPSPDTLDRFFRETTARFKSLLDTQLEAP